MEPRPWHDFYPERVPTSLTYPRIPVYELLQQAALEHPDVPALVFYGKETTYRQLWDKVSRFAGSLVDLGLERGDRVGIMLPTSPQFVVAFFATLKAGGVAVPTNPLYTAREVAHQWDDAEVDIGVTLDIFWDAVGEADEELDLSHIVVGDVKDELPFPLSLLYPLKKRSDHGSIDVPYGARVRSFRSLLKRDPWKKSYDVDPVEDVAVLQYTGGTTGFPKGAMLTHHNLVSNAVQGAIWLGADKAAGSNLSVLPFFHVYGLTTDLLVSVHRHATQILHPDPREVEAVLKLIDKHRPTLFPSVPALFIGMLEHPDTDEYDLSSLEGCFSGSAPLPVEVLNAFESRTGAVITEGFGLTEASPMTHGNPLEGTRKPGSVGVPFPDTDCRVVDAETGDEEMPVGEPGELVIHGPQVMKGYWNRPDETKRALRDGWLFTGDIATMDEDGYFTIVDRKKDMILASGFNIYPREVEEVLFELPEVVEAAVFGVPDEKRGETVAAALVLKDGATLTADDVEAYCRKNLTAYKVPKIIRFMDELPKSTVRKVLKRELVEMVQAER